MSQGYAELIAQWRTAAAETREAQVRLTVAFNAHLGGNTAAPEPASIQHLRKLQDVEHTKLQAAMECASKTDSGFPTGPGDL
jgi:hypothetical protein